VSRLAATPHPPYTAVIFTSIRTDGDDEGYAEMAARMDALAARQPGYLGIESARAELGITVSYWRSADDARAWKRVSEHLLAQQLGRDRWYEEYLVRVATVERDYGLAPDR
jgi:heme-degrading monooxygenase HmoA